MHTILPVTIEYIRISPGHNYFGRPKDGPAGFDTQEVESVEAHAGLGLKGDRYFGVAAHYNAQVTFISAEVLEAMQAELALANREDASTRRNIVIRGVPLLQLIGHEFSLDFGDESIDFAGASHCAPCAWMDAMIADGARAALRGRGGLRARILTDGTIRRGAAILRTEAPIDLAALTERMKLPALP
jgi:MOSC domain-containing protein YiiM